MNPINSIAPPSQPAPAPNAAPQAPSAPPAQNIPPELQPLVDQTSVIEWWMENVLMQTREGQQIVRDYMDTAPLVIQALETNPDRNAILQEMMTKYLLPTTAAIKEGDYETALKNYFCLMSYASKYAASLQQDPEIEATLQNFAAKSDQLGSDPAEASKVLGQGGGAAEGGAMDAASSPMGMSEPETPTPPSPSGAGATMPMQPPMAAPATAAPQAPAPAAPAGASPISNIRPRRQ